MNLQDVKLLCEVCIGCEAVTDGQSHCLVRERELEEEFEEISTGCDMCITCIGCEMGES